MARPSKFFQAFSGRKSSGEKPNFPTARTDRNPNSIASTVIPGSKLERMLGTHNSNALEVTLDKNTKRRDRSRQSSYASVVVSVGGDRDLVQNYTGTTDSNLKPPRATHGLRPQASSPLLGKQSIDDLGDWGNLTEANSIRLNPSESSSTLRSHYDAAKSPLSVSQQTSASSARDMALRKGHVQIFDSSPLSMEVSHKGSGTKDVELSTKHTRKTETKRRPPKLEISGLFPKPHVWNRPMLSPQRVVSSPSALSPNIAVHQSAKAKSSKAKASTKGEETSRPPPPYEYRMQYPVTSESGVSEAEVEAVDLEDPAEEVGYFQSRDFFYLEAMKSRGFAMENQVMTTQCNDFVLQEAFAEKRKEQRSQMPPTVYQPPRAPMVRSSLMSSNQSIRSRKTSNPDRSSNIRSMSSVASSVRSFGRIDPHLESFLELSSSDDEGERIVPSSRRTRGLSIRDSIEREDKGDKPLLCSAQLLKSIKPRPIINISSHGSFRAISKTVPGSRPTPSFHLPLRPIPDQRIPSVNWQQSNHIETSPTDSIHRVPSINQSTSRRSPRPRSPIDASPKPTTSTRKLMAVTQEEEELLEAMRRKRASMHQATSIALTSSTHPSHISLPPRPKTAEAKDRRSPFHDSLPDFPFPPDHSPLSLGHSPYAFSSDNLPHQETLPFPSPSTGQAHRRPISFLPALQWSPTLSFVPSDLLPSESTSETSLLTPVEGRGRDSPTLWRDSPAPWGGEKGAEGVVVVERSEEEDEVVGWALGRGRGGR